MDSILVNLEERYSQVKLNKTLYELILGVNKDFKGITIVNFGTDRCTGDSLAPLVGYQLEKTNYYKFELFGTLDNPVHNLNFKEAYDQIDHGSLIIAIDACLGKYEHIGHIQLSNKPLKPGTGVNKDIPEIGDISIKGIVNMSGFLPTQLLQCTRLSLVMKLANSITTAIKYSLYKLQETK